MELSNAKVAKLLRDVAAALTLKKANLFQIRAYEGVADAIEHSSSEIKDLWEDGNLDQIPGIGQSLKAHLDELFKTGKVSHFEEVKNGFPKQLFDFLDIPGIGPKIAKELVDLGVKSIEDLQKKIKDGNLVKQGFSAKIAEKIMDGIRELSSIKSGRMLLPYAFTQAEKILEYLKKNPVVEKADVLGSLRRMVATIGDLDFAIASVNPLKVVEHIINMPGVSRVVDKGQAKVTVILFSGLHLDFLIVDPKRYGALLQHFTGSKNHNIHLRTIAEDKGFSLSEYGIKNIKTGKVHPAKTEEEFYQLLGMQTPPPEIREDGGEIETALKDQLPKLVELKDLKGDLHLHSNFPLFSSHGPGSDNIEEIVKSAQSLGYEYIGIADHQPSFTNHTEDQIVELLKKRKKVIDQINYSDKNIRVLNLLEVDILPDGSLGIPTEALKLLDFALAGIHSSHKQPKELMTKRILKALENPYVKVLTHPTGRVLNERDSSKVNWDEVFKFAASKNIAMEINAFPNRLDLSDTLIRQAKVLGVKFVINTDSHNLLQLENMRFGVAMGRRGWLEAEDILNTWHWTKLDRWFKI